LKNITGFDEISFTGEHMILDCFVLHSFSKENLPYSVYWKRHI